MPLCMGGQGFGGFLDLCEKVFFLIQYSGAVLPPAGQDGSHLTKSLGHGFDASSLCSVMIMFHVQIYITVT
jgi:hypothetical protein